MKNTWSDRDLPVMRVAVRISDETLNGPVWVEQVAQEVDGLDEMDVRRAFHAIRPFFENVAAETDELGIMAISRPTPEARVRAGQWPSAEQVAEDFLRELERQAEEEPDPEKRGRIKKILVGFAEGGRDLGINLLAAVIAKQTGL